MILIEDAIYDEFTELIELTDHLLLLSDVISKTLNQSGKILSESTLFILIQ
jgi:hypothetical protein